MDDEGAIEISKGQWKNLRTFYLTYNYISNRGFKHIRLANYPKL